MIKLSLGRLNRFLRVFIRIHFSIFINTAVVPDFLVLVFGLSFSANVPMSFDVVSSSFIS